MVIEKDLGGYLKYVIVDDDLAVVDPRYMKDYELSLKPRVGSLRLRYPRLLKVALYIYFSGVVMHVLLKTIAG